MPTKSKKTVVKSASLEKVVDNSLAALSAANANGDKAIAVLSRTAKSLTAASKRLSKKRATLSKRKKTASAKLKKDNNADNRKLLRDTVRELAAVRKLAAKTTADKSANSEELKGLKAQAKRSKAYLSVLEKADKVLNKPKKARRKRRVSK